MADYIPIESCREGYLYRIRSRNLSFGIFRKTVGRDKNGFIGIREKFGSLYLFTEFHYDNGAPYGTVYPEAELEQCPVVQLEEDLGTKCETCDLPMDLSKDRQAGWIHVAAGDCTAGRPVSIPNKALFDYLRKVAGPHLCGWCRSGEHSRCRRPRSGLCECTCPLQFPPSGSRL